MPGFEPGASYMRSKRSTTELHPHAFTVCQRTALHTVIGYHVSSNYELIIHISKFKMNIDRVCGISYVLFNLNHDERHINEHIKKSSIKRDCRYPKKTVIMSILKV